MTAATLDEAIELQNAVDYGLTAGIHSLDPDEVADWLDRVQAGNLYVNRGITGAIVRRQPFGGWKRSSVGPGAKAGGPNMLVTLGSWHPVPTPPTGELHLDGIDERVRAFVEGAQPGLDYDGFERVRAGVFSDGLAWEVEFGRSRDVSNLGVERNVFRYRPTDVTVRLADGGSLAELVRVLAAGVLTRATIRVSSSVPLPSGILPHISGPLPLLRIDDVQIESDAAFETRIAARPPSRIRLIGGSAAGLSAVLGGAPDVAIWAGAVTDAGRLELLPFLREQAVAITAHRFGTPDPRMSALEV